MKRKTEFAWERQPGEGEEAYEAFTLYYKAGAKRGIRAVATQIGKSRTTCEKWSARYRWVDRARAYDNAIVQAEFKEAIAGIKQMNKKHADIGQLVLAKGLEILENIKVKKVGAVTAAQLISLGAEMERKARTLDVDLYTKQQKTAEEHGTEYVDDGLAAALENAAKKVWKK